MDWSVGTEGSPPVASRRRSAAGVASRANVNRSLANWLVLRGQTSGEMVH